MAILSQSSESPSCSMVLGNARCGDQIWTQMWTQPRRAPSHIRPRDRHSLPHRSRASRGPPRPHVRPTTSQYWTLVVVLEWHACARKAIQRYPMLTPRERTELLVFIEAGAREEDVRTAHHKFAEERRRANR